MAAFRRKVAAFVWFEKTAPVQGAAAKTGAPPEGNIHKVIIIAAINNNGYYIAIIINFIYNY